jgi:flavin reductase (DIM6/NTAB) family NADH-FMN oxidoreductase RutF
MVYNKEDIVQLPKSFRTQLINSLSGFKSVTLVGTQNLAQQKNLAIMSQVFHIGADPALMGLLIRPDSADRHTLSNILETEQYTFNHIHGAIVKQAHQTSARYPQAISEFEACNLESEYIYDFQAPFVKSSKVKIGLHLEERVDLKINGTILIIGSIQLIDLPNDSINTDGFLDLNKAGTITCNGLDAYLGTIKLERLSYAKPDKPLESIPY